MLRLGDWGWSTKLVGAALTAAMMCACGGDKAKGDKKGDPAGTKPAAPPKAAPEKAPSGEAKAPAAEAKKPEAKAPEKAPEAKPVAPKANPVADAKTALAAAKGAAATDALTKLRTYIDRTPTAPDLADASKLLAAEAVERASQLIEQGDVKGARAMIATLVTDDGSLAPGVAKGLIMGRETIARVAKLVHSAGLDDLEALREAAKAEGPLGTAAKRVLVHVEKPIRAVFAADAPAEGRDARVATALPGKMALCKDARESGDPRKCPPAHFGLKDKAAMDAAPDAMFPLLRAAALSRGMGITVKGIEELPLPETTAGEAPASTSETSTAVPAAVVVLNAAGVHVSRRGLLNLADGVVDAAAWPGAVVMTTEALTAAEKPEEMAPLVEALKAAKAAAGAFETTVYADKAPNKGKEANLSIMADVSAEVPAKLTRKVLGALEAAGYTDVRYRRQKKDAQVLAVPTTAAVIPEARQGRKEARPVLVHLTKEGADVFEPKGGEGEAPKEAAPVALPGKAKRWYKGTKVFKITVTDTGTDALVQTVRSVRQASAAGTVVVVSAADDVPTSRVVATAAAIAEARGPADQAKISEVFPGQACADEGGDAERKGCRSLFPVVPAKVDVPSARGLTDAPVKKVVEKKPKPKPEPKPEPPKLGFCDKADIKRVIRARTGSFKFCYERRLQLNNSLAGRVVGRLTIGGSGQVLSATTSGSMPDKKVHECVAKQLKKLKFKPPENGGKCVVSYPFTFKP